MEERFGVTVPADALASIALPDDLNGRIRRHLMGTHRAASFRMRSRRLSAEPLEAPHRILRDIDALDGPTAILFDKIRVLVQAAVGCIPINQNKIIPLLSVASVALLPPTPMARIDGMHFRFVPERDRRLGRRFAPAPMLVSVALRFSIVRRKGWLKSAPWERQTQAAAQCARSRFFTPRNTAPSQGRCSYSSSAASQ